MRTASSTARTVARSAGEISPLGHTTSAPACTPRKPSRRASASVKSNWRPAASGPRSTTCGEHGLAVERDEDARAARQRRMRDALGLLRDHAAARALATEDLRAARARERGERADRLRAARPRDAHVARRPRAPSRRRAARVHRARSRVQRARAPAHAPPCRSPGERRARRADDPAPRPGAPSGAPRRPNTRRAAGSAERLEVVVRSPAVGRQPPATAGSGSGSARVRRFGSGSGSGSRFRLGKREQRSDRLGRQLDDRPRIVVERLLGSLLGALPGAARSPATRRAPPRGASAEAIHVGASSRVCLRVADRDLLERLRPAAG